MNLPIVVLAGGLGTRLHPVTKYIPKSLVPIHGYPFIYWQLRLLKSQDCTEVMLCVGHLGDAIRDYVGNGHKFGLKISYCLDGSENIGTGGALAKAFKILQSNAAVIYGDSYLLADFKNLEEEFNDSKKFGLMSVYQNRNKYIQSNVRIADSEVVEYTKQVSMENLEFIDYGLNFFNRQVFEIFNYGANWDLTALITELIQIKSLRAYEVQEEFYEVGSRQGIKNFENYLKGKI
jgi:NDP-sugar pyrophosphorylase family protein